MQGGVIDCGLFECGLRIADCGLFDCGLRIADYLIADCGLRIADYLRECAVLIEAATME
ncbi:MAG: hypothetical protein AB2777_22655 [Candidatus Thiodiazotropha endolucinida]